MHPRNIDNEQLRNIGNEVEQRIPKNTAKKTTTKNGPRSLAINGNGVAHKVVVASSLASEDEDPRDIVEKLTGEFGLSRSQSRLIEDYLNNRGSRYVLEKAAIVRSQPRKNLGGAFEKALEDDWKAPKASEPPKRQKYQPAIPDPPLSSEEKQAEVAQMEERLERPKHGGFWPTRTRDLLGSSEWTP
jgi:hypothetical protein